MEMVQRPPELPLRQLRPLYYLVCISNALWHAGETLSESFADGRVMNVFENWCGKRLHVGCKHDSTSLSLVHCNALQVVHPVGVVVRGFASVVRHPLEPVLED